MRRLAGEVGIGTMTLYGYFRSKDELLNAAVDAAVADSATPTLNGPWQQRLRQLMSETRHALGRHPALVSVRVRRPVLRPEALRFCELTMAILAEAGFDPAEAARAFRLFFTYVLGFAAFGPPGSEADQARQARAAVAALPPGEFPAMSAAAAELAGAMAGSDTFDFGLDVIIAGLERRVEER